MQRAGDLRAGQQKIVQVDLLQLAPAAEQKDVPETAADGIDAAGAEQKVQRGIAGAALVLAGRLHVAGDIDVDGTLAFQHGIDADIAGEGVRQLLLHGGLQVRRHHAGDVHGAEAGQENIALRIDRRGGLRGDAAIDVDGDVVAGLDDVVGVGRGAGGRVGVGEQAGAERDQIVGALLHGVQRGQWRAAGADGHGRGDAGINRRVLPRRQRGLRRENGVIVGALRRGVALLHDGGQRPRRDIAAAQAAGRRRLRHGVVGQAEEETNRGEAGKKPHGCVPGLAAGASGGMSRQAVPSLHANFCAGNAPAAARV